MPGRPKGVAAQQLFGLSHASSAQSTDARSQRDMAAVRTAVDTGLPSGSADDVDHGVSYLLMLTPV